MAGYNLDYFKEKASDNKKVVVIIIVILLLLILIPTGINIVKNLPTYDEEIEVEEVVELTSAQAAIVDKYNDEVKDLNAFLENSKWIDNSGLGNVKFKKNQMTESKNEQEYKQKYAICSIDKTSERIGQNIMDWIYTMSLLMENGDYKVLKLKKTLQGTSETSPVMSSTLEGSSGLFKVSDRYSRISNTDDFSIPNWNSNANQFFDNKYDEMYKSLKDYCAKNFPQINSLEWTGEVDINYLNSSISMIFTIKTKTNVSIIATYNKQDGNFTVYKGK